MNIAHRNLRPCNIIYSLNDRKWKFTNFQYALEYDEMVDYYEIVGEETYLPEELRQIKRINNFFKKVRQNLLVNDLFALSHCFKQLIQSSDSMIN